MLKVKYLLPFLIIAVFAHTVSATIFINESGVYRINKDLFNVSVVIRAKNVILNGCGHEIVGNGRFGLSVYGSSNVTVENLRVRGGWYYGLYVVNSTDIRIKNVKVTDCVDGIDVENSSSILIANDSVGNNHNNGIRLFRTDRSIVVNDTVYDNVWNGIRLKWSNFNYVIGNRVEYNRHGVCMNSSNFNVLKFNRVLNNVVGVRLVYCSGDDLEDNTVGLNLKFGIFLRKYDFDIDLINNTVYGNRVGIFLDSSNRSLLYGNNVTLNEIGLLIVNVRGDVVHRNRVSNNLKGAILKGCYGNLIYDNYFSNHVNAYDDGANVWNVTKRRGINIVGGKYVGGNYWSDYGGKDLNGDGLGDTDLPYDSGGRIKRGGDMLPLVLD